MPATSYLDIAAAIKTAQPGIHLHAFRPSDIVDGASRLGLSDDDFLRAAQEFGVNTIPGTGVKILSEAFRSRAAPGDLPIARWTSIIRAAHHLGLRSTSVMVYGLGESAEDRIAHLRELVRIHQDTGGFTEFVPMPAQADYLVAGRSETDEHRAVHAVARLMLNGEINHLQVPWTRLGFEQAAVMLQSGADDLGGTLCDGNVAPAAGAEQGRVMTISDVERIARSLSRPTRQRTTEYGEPSDERKAVARA
jgi:FO synthase